MPTPDDLTTGAAELQQKALAENLIEHQIKVVSAVYEKAAAYTNLIIVAGYAAFFGLWTLTKPFLLKPHALWAALLMLISAATFVLFEVYKMFFTSRFLTERYMLLSQRLKGKSLQEVVAEFERINTEVRASTLRFLVAWKVCLLICVPSGVTAVAILVYAFVRALLSGSI